jgi:cytochrome c-type biogenesis protein
VLTQLPTIDPRIALAFSAGFFTFLAPCAFPLLPGYVAYFVGTGDDEPLPIGRRLLKAVGVAAVVSGGFFLVSAVVAAMAAVLGSGPLRDISLLEPVVGLLLVGLGTVMLSGRFQPSALHVRLPERRRSSLGYFLFGVVYAVAAIGCTGPIFLGLVLYAVEAGPATTVAVFGAYGLGMSVMMLGVTLLSALGREAVLRQLSGASGKLTRVAGGVLILAGIAQIYAFLFLYDGLKTLGLA